MGKLKEVSRLKEKENFFLTLKKNRETLSNKFQIFNVVFILDQILIKISKISRANRSAICKTYEIKPSFGYYAAQKSIYFGDKFHLIF